MNTQQSETRAAGDIDTNFGTEGTVDLKPHSFNSVWDLALTPERKILAVGGATGNEFIVGCLSENGKIDTSFGSQGLVRRQFETYPSEGRSINVLADGKILIIGDYIHTEASQVLPAASRLEANGSLDLTFGNRGFFIFPPVETTGKIAHLDPISKRRASVGSSALSIVLPDGKTLIVHTLLTFGYGLLIRLTAQGVLDESFNDTGYTIVRFPNDQVIITLINSVTATSKGEIVIGGQIELMGKGTRGMLARYGADGRPDSSFGTDGSGFIALTEGQRSSRVDDLVAGEADKFVGVGAISGLEGKKQAAIIFGRMANGIPDHAFNEGQMAEFGYRENTEWYSAAATPTTDNIVVTGIAFHDDYKTEGVIVARYLPAGELDTNFGRGRGWVPLESGLEPRLTLQADGKMLICYALSTPPASTPVVTRLLN